MSAATARKVPTCYTHRRRPKWGASVLAWERADRRGYLFEDGTLRVIAEPFYKHMVPVQVAAELFDVFERHLSELELDDAVGRTGSARNSSGRFSVDEQLTLVQKEYAGRFSGSVWLEQMRGQGVARRLKRHRDAAIADAASVLGAESIDRALTENRSVQLWTTIADMLHRTDLVAARELQTLRRRLPAADRALTRSLRSLLYRGASEVTTAARLSQFIEDLQRWLGCAASWNLATVFLALAAPDQHICVRPVGLRKMARWSGRRLIRSSQPNGTDYVQVLEMAQELRMQLDQPGAAPADLMDVYDFIRVTTTPSAEKHMLALRNSAQSRAGDGLSESTAEDDPDSVAA